MIDATVTGHIARNRDMDFVMQTDRQTLWTVSHLNREDPPLYRAKERLFRQRPRVDWLRGAIKDRAHPVLQWARADEA